MWGSLVVHQKGVSMKVGIVVPCYNEEGNVERLYSCLQKEVFAGRSESDIEFTVLYVNDGSKDATLVSLRNMSRTYPEVRYLSFSRNFGKEAAMLAGLKALVDNQYDLIGLMDADCQDPPSLLNDMIDRLIADPEVDCVATRRSNRKGEKPFRSMFSNLFYKLMDRMADVKIVSGARDFRLMRLEMASAIVSLNEKTRFSKGLFEWVGYNTEWISFENCTRNEGQTKWSFIRLCSYGSFVNLKICCGSGKMI